MPRALFWDHLSSYLLLLFREVYIHFHCLDDTQLSLTSNFLKMTSNKTEFLIGSKAPCSLANESYIQESLLPPMPPTTTVIPSIAALPNPPSIQPPPLKYFDSPVKVMRDLSDSHVYAYWKMSVKVPSPASIKNPSGCCVGWVVWLDLYRARVKL